MQYISMLDNLAERHITYTCNIANVYQKNFKNLLSIYVKFVVLKQMYNNVLVWAHTSPFIH